MTSITLQYPIDNAGTSIASVNVRRPTAGDMVELGDALPVLVALAEGGAEKLNSDAFAAMLKVAATLTTLGDNAKNLDFADLQTIVEAGMSELGKSQAGQGTTG